MPNSRILRGIFGLAATWGAALSALATSTLVVGLATGAVPSAFFGAPEIIAVAVRGLAVGAVAGGLFGWSLVARERHETLATLSLKRTTLWGTIAAASVPLLIVVASTGPALPLGVIAASIGGFGFGGGLFASSLLRLARRPTRSSPRRLTKPDREPDSCLPARDDGANMYRRCVMILLAMCSASSVQAQAGTPPPGACEAPAAAHRGEPGCYLTAELRIASPAPELHWHIVRVDDEAEARAEAGRHAIALVALSHGQHWLHVLGPKEERIAVGVRQAVIGPIRRTSTRPHIARFLEADFPPGMRTRTHAHSGPEAFYVVRGAQCMETPTERRTLQAGETYIVERGVHLQAAPTGRQNLVLVLHEDGQPWSTVDTTWTPTDYCTR